MKTKPLDVLKKIGGIIVSIVLCLLLVSIFGIVHDKIFPPTPTPTRVPTPTTPVRVKGSIHDFLASNKIRVDMKGAGIDEVEMLISKLVEEALEVDVPVGTIFVSESESIQLTGSDRWNRSVLSYCLDLRILITIATRITAMVINPKRGI